MPVHEPNVIDSIALSQGGAVVRMGMFEAREWDVADRMAAELEVKLNTYTRFVLGGQISDTPAFVGKPVAFELYSKWMPPREIMDSLARVRDDLKAHRIAFKVFAGEKAVQLL